MAEPRVVGPDDAGPDAPAPASPPAADGVPSGHSTGNGDPYGNGHPNGTTNGNGATPTDAVIRVLHPDAATIPAPPGPAHPIAWLAPADPSFVVLRDDLRDDLYDDLADDLADDLRDDLRQDLRLDLRHDLRLDLRQDLRADLDADLEDLREDLYEEIDDLRDDVFLDGDGNPTTVLPTAHFQTDIDTQRARAQRVAFVAASVLALVMTAAIVLLWQRADTAQIIAARPEAAVVAPPDLDNTIANVERLDQQLVGLLAVSATPAAPSDVATQIEALRVELAGVRGCLLAVRHAVDDGVDTASAIEYC